MSPEATDGGTNRQARDWAVWLHFSLILGALTFIGYMIPFVLWQIKREDMPEIDAHGKAAANWIASIVIYMFVSLLLVALVVGLPMLLLFFLLSLVFPIIGAIKADKGEVWKYPLSIRFLK